MRKHSQEFKDKIKVFGRELDSKLTYKDTSNGIQYNADDGTILESLAGKEISFDFSVFTKEKIESLCQKIDDYHQSELSLLYTHKIEDRFASITISVITSKRLKELSTYLGFPEEKIEENNIYLFFNYINDYPGEKSYLVYDFKNPSLTGFTSFKIPEDSLREEFNNFDVENKIFIDNMIIVSYKELGNEQLNAVTPVLQSALLKSVMKELDIDSNVDIPIGTIINYKFGVKLDSGDYEYLDFGNYQVYSSEKQEDNNAYNIVAYDKMLNSMVEYTALKDTSKTFPMTIRDYIGTICNDLNITFKDSETEFANYNRVIESDLYADLGYTYRDILDELAQVTASNIIINNNDELEIKYITDTEDTIDEEYLKDINVKFGEKYGPINSIVLSRSAGADNVYIQDEQSITDNGLCELKINDNQIMNFNDRSDYLPDILKKLGDLEYHINDFSSTGVCYYEIADKYNVKIGDNTYTCIMFNDEIDVTQGLEEIIHTDLPEQAETDYTKADKTDRKINQTYLIVDKQNQTIESVVSKTDGFDERITKAEQTVDGFSQTVEGRFKDIDGQIKDVQGEVSLKLNTDDLFSQFNVNVDQVVINSKNFKLTKEGDVTTHNIDIQGGTLDLIDDGTEESASIKITKKEEIYGYHINIGTDLKNCFMCINPGIIGFLPGGNSDCNAILIETENPTNSNQKGYIDYTYNATDGTYSFAFKDYNKTKTTIFKFNIDNNKKYKETIGTMKKFSDVFKNAIATKVVNINITGLVDDEDFETFIQRTQDISSSLYYYNNDNKNIELSSYYSSSGIIIENIDKNNIITEKNKTLSNIDWYMADAIMNNSNYFHLSEPLSEQIERYDYNKNGIIDQDDLSSILHIGTMDVDDGKIIKHELNSNDFNFPLKIGNNGVEIANEMIRISDERKSSENCTTIFSNMIRFFGNTTNNNLVQITSDDIRLSKVTNRYNNGEYTTEVNSYINHEKLNVPYVELTQNPTASNHAIRLQDLDNRINSNILRGTNSIYFEMNIPFVVFVKVFTTFPQYGGIGIVLGGYDIHWIYSDGIDTTRNPDNTYSITSIWGNCNITALKLN